MTSKILLIFTTGLLFLYQDHPELSGKLEPDLLPDESATGMGWLKPLTPAALSKLKLELQEGDKAFSTYIYWRLKTGHQIHVVMVEPAKGNPYLYIDKNLDGVMSKTESIVFSKVGDDPNNTFDGEIAFDIPLTIGPFKHYPIVFKRFTMKNDPAAREGSRGLLYSFFANARGYVRINDRQVLVEYGEFDPTTGQIDVRNGRLSFDIDGNGKIDKNNFSSETTLARSEDVIFRLGDKYVSTKSIDTSTGLITLRSHEPSEYRRIELKLGEEFPDFSFQDFQGKPRKLSEFRGKYVLMEFWATWCGPCIAEIPYLKSAYAKYQDRGFEILGMDNDDQIEKARALITEKKMTWPQATTPSIKDLLEFRLRVKAYPSNVLLDPQGRVISLGLKDHLPLKQEKLLQTLEKLLPQKN
ncbi:MAG TPA: TlpA disulfide reductase family protein [Pyrinomonadaceae bacterium]|nr:TlpA disulfide reductase family protein [Pyrinomonadaceae bacterium]